MSNEKAKSKIDIVGNIMELRKFKKAGQDKVFVDSIQSIKTEATSISKGIVDKIDSVLKELVLEDVPAVKEAIKEVKKPVEDVKTEPIKEKEVEVTAKLQKTEQEIAEVKKEEVKEVKNVETSAPKKVEKVEKPAEIKYEKVISDKRPQRDRNNQPKFNRNQNTNNNNNNKPNNRNNNQFNKNQNGKPFEKNFEKGGQPFNKDKNTLNKKPVYQETADVAATNKYANKQSRKKTTVVEEKKSLNKRTLLKKGYIQDDTLINDAEFSTRKAKKKQSKVKVEAIKITNAVVNSEIFPIKTLAEKIGKTSTEIVKQLFVLGIMKTINDDISFDEAELVSSELGVTLEYVPSETFEDKLDQLSAEEDDDKDLVKRPPVVTIMGHVDHGKTTLLDYIRKANVAGVEAGGITQHIGAYTAKVDDQTITFLDTPGHEAFTSMRLRGAQATDIAIIVVAADDGIMPQTVEAINHAKIAGVEIIIAITKCDKPEANPDRILQQLTEHDLLPEAWGGSTPVCKVSAKTGEGVNELLETVILVAEILELKANPNRLAKGIIIEAKLDKGRGPVATVLVQNGTLHIQDYVVAGTTSGKIRAMFNPKGQKVKVAGPSAPVSVLGFSDVPTAGDQLIAVEDERLAKQVVKEREDKIKSQQKSTIKMNLEDMFNQIASGDLKELKLIVKADVQGSVEAVKQAMEKLSNNEVKVKVIHGAAGAVNESDVMLAETSGAIIIAFNVRPDANAKSYAEKKEIDIRTYRVIYDAIDDVEKAMKGMLAPKFKEVVYGTCEVRETFKVSNVGTIAGCMVLTGKVVRNSKLRLVRDGVIITEGEIASLKRFKDDVKEVAKGYECGLGIENFNDIKVGDVIESYNMEQINE